MGLDAAKMRVNPGEVFGALAYAHPFLEGNGRTIMTVHADLARRAGFHIDWAPISKTLIVPHMRPGSMPTERSAASLATNPGLNRPSPSPSP